MNTVVRHARLMAAFWRYSLRQAVEFRANFIANLLTNVGWMASLILFLAFIFHNTHAIGTWTEPQMFILFGTYSLVRGISNTLFYTNLSQFPTYVRTGEMDYLLLKPINSQFYVSLRYVALDDLGQSVGALFVIAFGWSQLHAGPPTLAALGSYLALLCVAMVLFYAINMIMMTFAFWLVRLDNLMVLADTMFQIARTPIDIFGAFGSLPRFFLTYVLPLAFLATMPVKALVLPQNAGASLWIGICLAAFFMLVSICLWNTATRSYSSASS